MKQKGTLFAALIALSLSGCTEHRPQDTVYVPQPEPEKAEQPKPAKGLRVYTGTIPCADCSGIEQRLALKGDSTGIFRLTETYKNATEDGDAVLVTTGEWKRRKLKIDNREATVFYLSEGDIKDSTRIINYEVSPDKIVQLDTGTGRITNTAAYTLKLVRKEK